AEDAIAGGRLPEDAVALTERHPLDAVARGCLPNHAVTVRPRRLVDPLHPEGVRRIGGHHDTEHRRSWDALAGRDRGRGDADRICKQRGTALRGGVDPRPGDRGGDDTVTGCCLAVDTLDAVAVDAVEEVAGAVHPEVAARAVDAGAAAAVAVAPD